MPTPFITYRVEDADGEFLDEFTTNATSVAKGRIGRIRKYRPGLTVTETLDRSDEYRSRLAREWEAHR